MLDRDTNPSPGGNDCRNADLTEHTAPKSEQVSLQREALPRGTTKHSNSTRGNLKKGPGDDHRKLVLIFPHCIGFFI